MSKEAKVEFYAERIPIYPRSVKGRFRTLKWGVLILAYGVYFLLPWLRWERAVGPDQAVLWDLEGRLFYLFDLVVHPQDIFWLAGFLVIAALLLFFVTGIAGRVFCGYFCFQTLWTDVYVLIERIVQGERPARIRLGKQPWNFDKIRKIGLTHLLWLAVAALTALSFVLYWGNAPELTLAIFTGQAAFPAYATIAFLTATTYLMAGLAREQVCTYMCPYSRFQSAMFDRDTLIVSYLNGRGEGASGRAKIAKGLKTHEERQAKGVGDCIDCGFCVQVCPMGIDIRNGLQVQCIHCALCIDACDNIMDSLNWPRGLIRYTSDNAMSGKKTRILKAKTYGYGLALVLTTALLVWSVASHALMDVSVRQMRQPMYVRLANGDIQNSYEIKVNNKTQTPVEIKLELEGLEGAELDMGRITELRVKPEDNMRVLVRVKWTARGIKKGQHEFHFIVNAHNRDDIDPVRIESHFYTP